MSRLVSLLSTETGLHPHDVRAIITHAPISYKKYFIEKRNGGKRLISQPAREVKMLQRILVRRFADLPVHPAAAAYVRGQSIKDNATRHASNGPILKYDFKEFFTSIRERDWQQYCRTHNLFADPEDIILSTKIFFTRVYGSTILRLAIGAPSSPWLSNVLMFDFDENISRAVAKDQVTYSRYADDLTFSAKRTGYLNGVDKALRKILSESSHPKLTINEEKTFLATKKYRRTVTGLVLANDGSVTIGRDRKREIRAALHKAFLGHVDAEAMARLAGLLSFVHDVEPSYFARITAQYGDDVVSKLLAGRP